MIQFHDFSEERLQDVLQLYERNDDYFYLSGQQKATVEDVWHDVCTIPEGVTAAQHHVVLIDVDEQLAGIFIYIEHYPTLDTLYIGLLLLDPSFHSSGLGSFIIHQLQEELCPPLRKIRLAVLRSNEAAKRFWLRQHFHVVDERAITIHSHPHIAHILQFEK